MIPKTEPSENIPKSSSPLSLDSIVKDLKSLEKSLVSDKVKAQNQLKIVDSKMKMLELENDRSKTQLNNMKSKMKLLEEQNSKLKSDLEASESDKILYHGQYKKNGRELRELTKEIESLRAKHIELLEAKCVQVSREAKSQIFEITSEADESEIDGEANRLSDLYAAGNLYSDNDDNDVTHFGDLVDNAPDWTRCKLKINDGTSKERSMIEPCQNMTPSNNEEMDRRIPLRPLALEFLEEMPSEQTSSHQNKRKSSSENEIEDIPKSKKACSETVGLSWSCKIDYCLPRGAHANLDAMISELRAFKTKAELHAHVREKHTNRTWFCKRCPFTSTNRSKLTKHENLHYENEMKFKDNEYAGKCNLCNIWFPPGSALGNHNKFYHAV